MPLSQPQGEPDENVTQIKLSMRLVRLTSANGLLLAHFHIPIGVLERGTEDSAIDICFEALEEALGPALQLRQNVQQQTFSLEGSYTLSHRGTGEERNWTSSFSQTGSFGGQLLPFVPLTSRQQVFAAVFSAKRPEHVQFELVESVHAKRPDTQWQFEKLGAIIGEVDY